MSSTATAGIGRAVAIRLAANGAEVVVHGRDARRGAELVSALADRGGRARFVAADLANAEDVERLAADAGQVDILVNNAGCTGAHSGDGADAGRPRRRKDQVTARGRIGDPEEIAEVVLFLVEERSSYVNGTVVAVHGGERSLLPG
jgi:NAD(P)-dependent dehydrogenase (short-subunit alcohol dehydrogenase family)